MMMMKSGALLIIFLLALLTTVQSSSLPINNITINSSIYASSSSSIQTSNSSYWLSPSGVFAFGFYPLCYNCDQYKVAIWIHKPSNKVSVEWSDNNNEPTYSGSSNNRPSSEVVVVWSNNNNEPIYSGSSIQLAQDGVFTIQLANSTMKPLFNSTLGPAAYALMQDTGNFVVYNSDSNIVWQSFDHPTDTILQGQTLKPDERLLVPITGQKLIMQKYGNLELFEVRQHYTDEESNSPQYVHGKPYLSEDIIWQTKTCKEGGGVVLILDSTGHLNLVDKDGIVIKKLTKGKKRNKGSNGSLETTIHRATLESDGVLLLYAERIGPPTIHGSKTSVLLWESYCKKCEQQKDTIEIVRLFFAILGGIMLGALLLVLVIACCAQLCEQQSYY